jgi:phage terminase large subunit-like protein
MMMSAGAAANPSELSDLRDRDLSTVLDLLKDASPNERDEVLAGLELLGYDWRTKARESQLPPEGDWFIWLILAGRGWGKTLTGAEFAKDGCDQSLMRRPHMRWAFVAETFGDGRDTMVEGETGFLSIVPPSALRGGTIDGAWNRSMGELFLANGSQLKIYSSEKPNQLRGPQHHGAWGDEPAKWKDAHKGEGEDTTWSNLMLGLRLGEDPRGVMTTTPRPNALIKRLNAAASTFVTRGTTYENLENLSPTFREYVLSRYEGTRLGQQELMAQILDDYLGALWRREQIDEHRVELDGTPEDIIKELGLRKIYVGVDPSTFSPETGDDPGTVAQGTETGIVVAGIDSKPRPHVYVLEDLSCRETGETWARRVTEAYHRWHATAVVPEMNMAGPLVLSTLRLTDPSVTIYRDKNGKPGVRAAQGKRARAEPVATLAEQGRLHHVGTLGPLEDSLCGWDPQENWSPDRLDAMVWAVTALEPWRGGRSRTYGAQNAQVQMIDLPKR